MRYEEDLSKTYNFNSFCDLREFFRIRKKLFRITEAEYHIYINTLPESIRNFIIEENFQDELDDLNKNCSTLKTFDIRFFQKFNAFKILKYLNYAHTNYYEKAELDSQTGLLNLNLQRFS